MKVVLVTGGRNYDDAQRVGEVLGRHDPDIVIHGAARGADQIAHEWATGMAKQVLRFPPDWQTHGLSAGQRRNEVMADRLNDFRTEGYTVQVVAFPGGRGTAGMVRIAMRHGFPLEIVR